MARASDRKRTAMVAAGIGVALAGHELLQRWREVDLSGRVALVTGGSRGLGLLIARELADEGCALAVCARDDQELDRARQDLARRGADVFAVPCDVSDRAQVAHLVGRIMDRFGRID